jgi:glucose 1-dehydrogenase
LPRKNRRARPHEQASNPLPRQVCVAIVADGQRFIEQAVRAPGKVDILVSNAGLEKRADFWVVTEEDFDALLNVNVKGMFFCDGSGGAIVGNRGALEE